MKWDTMIYYERQDAKNEGKIEGMIESLLDVLNEYGEVSDDLKEMILKETNLDKVKQWTKLAARASSLEEFMKQMNINITYHQATML